MGSLHNVPSCFHLSEGAVRRSVVFGECFELQRVEGILSATDVLHRVLSPAALAEETGGGRRGGFRQNENKKKKGMMLDLTEDKIFFSRLNKINI